MPIRIHILGAVLLALGLPSSLFAQIVSTPDLQAMTAAVKLRSDMAENIVKGLEKPDAAITRLRAQDSPSGLKVDHDADIAYAAIDVGQRLIPKGQPAAAAQFFQEAEQSLEAVLSRTPNTAAANKALLLQNLAFIRGNYLNKAVQARADIEAAIKLQPDDKHLQVFRDSFAKDKATIFKSAPKG